MASRSSSSCRSSPPTAPSPIRPRSNRSSTRINHNGDDLVEIELYPSGTLGRVQKELPQLVLDGTADIAFIIPGRSELFPDNAVVELPGLFRDVREATLTYTRLVANGALAGYRDFFPIGVFATQPEIINSRKPIHTIGDLKGLRIRTNNNTQAKALARLGAVPKVLAFNETAAELSSGALDAATVPPAQLFDVGIGRLTSNHYLLGTSSAPLALADEPPRCSIACPSRPQALILRQYSGEWTAAQLRRRATRSRKRRRRGGNRRPTHRRKRRHAFTEADRGHRLSAAFKADRRRAGPPQTRTTAILLTAAEAGARQDAEGRRRDERDRISIGVRTRRRPAGAPPRRAALLRRCCRRWPPQRQPVELKLLLFRLGARPTSISGSASSPSSTPSMPRERVMIAIAGP